MKQIKLRPESRESLIESGIRAISTIGGGIALLVLRGLAGFGGISIPGIVAGGALSIFGLGTAGGSKHRADRVGGVATAAVGALTLAASLPILGLPASVVMWIGGLGLIGYGVATVVQFLRGLRTRK